MRIGFDVDGVLADFNTAFAKRVIDITGEDLLGPNPTFPCWAWPKHYGYTASQENAVWEKVKADYFFWRHLPAYSYTQNFLNAVAVSLDINHDIYFITSRPGVNAKFQTETWLENRLFPSPTVLISSAKGLCAEALDLDIYIDDRWENCMDVVAHSVNTKVYLLDQPWNWDYTDVCFAHPRIKRISSPFEMDLPLGTPAQL